MLTVLTESNDVAKKRKSVALLKGPKKTKKLCSSSTGSVKHQESTILLISDDHDFTIQYVVINLAAEIL